MSLKWLPTVIEDLCTGCGLCVEACSPRCLAVLGGVAVLTDAQACGSEEHCVPACPEGAIAMGWSPATGDRSIGAWRERTP